MRHYNNYEVFKQANLVERLRIARRNLTKNLIITIYYFDRRVYKFVKEVLKLKFNVVDYQYRFKQQSRRSTYIHSFIQIKGRPALLDSLLTTDTKRQQFADFQGLYMSTINLSITIERPPLEERTPISILASNITNTLQNLTDLLNIVQKHRNYTESYYLRKKSRTDKISYRFYFPRMLQAAADVSKKINPSNYTFALERNNERLNNYNRVTTISQIANIDIAPYVDARAIINYLAKYASKSEEQSTNYKTLAKELLSRISSNAPLLSLISKLINKLIAKRN